jgi:hypothetical protein
MPCKCSTTYHMKGKEKDYQCRITFHPNVKVHNKNIYL